MDFLTIVPLKFVHQGAIGTNITIDTLCGIMNDESAGDPLARYAKVNSLMLDTHGEKCLDSSYEDMISELRQISWSSGAAEGGLSSELKRN